MSHTLMQSETGVGCYMASALFANCAALALHYLQIAQDQSCAEYQSARNTNISESASETITFVYPN